MPHRRLTEEEILRLFRRELRLEKPHELNLTGNTDDAAIMPLLPSLFKTHSPLAKAKKPALSDGIVLTQDGLVEGVHFRLDYYTPSQAIAKCMAVSLSDLAAMGAQPLGALVYVGLPSKYADEEFVLSLAAGLRASMRKYKYTLFGGDLTRARDLTVSAVMLGRIECRHAMTRSSAHVGDTLFLSGPVGLASLGLRLLERQRARRRLSELKDNHVSVKRIKAPEPRLKLGIKLAQTGRVTSCIDLSDSLSKSLLLLAKESRVGLELNVTRRLVHPEVRNYLGKLDSIALMRAALSAEEDFELLFTSGAQTAGELGLPQRQAMAIGRIVPASRGVHAIIGRTCLEIPLLGYEHFGS